MLATAMKETRFIQELQEKYEQVLDTYNKKVQKRINLENKMIGHKGKSR